MIYEVNVRQYTPEGTLAALRSHIPRLKALGVDILWLMPVQPIGMKNRKGKLGSYYAISDYTAVNPEFGTLADFKAVVDAAHSQGLEVILDWVANHTAFDHEWVTAHPDFYERKPDGSLMNARDNEGHETDWTDVAELQYTNPALRQAMIGEMKWWVDSTGIDGFRCDVAGGVPTDFWVQARTALKAARPDLFFLAEAEDPGIHAAFDMTYGWELHHLLNAIAQGKAERVGARRVLREERQPVRAGCLSHVLHHQPRREQLERLGVRTHGREPQAGVHPERDGGGLDAAAVQRPGGQHEEAPAVLREGHH